MINIVVGILFIAIVAYLAITRNILPTIEDYSMGIISGALFILGLFLVIRELG